MAHLNIDFFKITDADGTALDLSDIMSAARQQAVSRYSLTKIISFLILCVPMGPFGLVKSLAFEPTFR